MKVIILLTGTIIFRNWWSSMLQVSGRLIWAGVKETLILLLPLRSLVNCPCFLSLEDKRTFLNNHNV